MRVTCIDGGHIHERSDGLHVDYAVVTLQEEDGDAESFRHETRSNIYQAAIGRFFGGREDVVLTNRCRIDVRAK